MISPTINENGTRVRSGFSAPDEGNCKEIKPEEDQLENDFV
jgi:hypothetical protein